MSETNFAPEVLAPIRVIVGDEVSSPILMQLSHTRIPGATIGAGKILWPHKSQRHRKNDSGHSRTSEKLPWVNLMIGSLLLPVANAG